MDFTGKTVIVSGGARGLGIKASNAEEVAAAWDRIEQPQTLS